MLLMRFVYDPGNLKGIARSLFYDDDINTLTDVSLLSVFN
jgi:hypothetical protein